MRDDVKMMNEVDAAIKAADGDLRRAMGNVQLLAAKYGEHALLRAMTCNYAVMMQRLQTQGKLSDAA